MANIPRLSSGPSAHSLPAASGEGMPGMASLPVLAGRVWREGAGEGLGRTLNLATECLSTNFAAVPDPLRIDFPPLPPMSREATITASALRMLAALYLQANLEQAGILPVAEFLGAARDQLQFLSTEAARKLEPFARPPQSAYTRAQREALFGRVFGISGTQQANHEFEQLLATLCLSLMRCELELRLANDLGAARKAGLRYSAQALLFNLAPRQFGNTLFAAQAIDQQLRLAVAALTDASLLSQFGARTLWDVIRFVVDPAPDAGRHLARGEAGLAVLKWLGSILGNLGTTSARLVARGDAIFLYAARWLEASGLSGAVTP
jgi:hypothetical protein